MSLSSQLKQHFKKQAHILKPTVSIGQQGLTPAVLLEIEQTLQAHELVKLRLYGTDKENCKQIANTICISTHAELIQIIGHTVVIYKRKPQKPKIKKD